MFSEKAFVLLSCAVVMASSSVMYSNYEEPSLGSYSSALESRGYEWSRTKRYPAHLEPNIMAMGAKFWIRPGGTPKISF